MCRPPGVCSWARVTATSSATAPGLRPTTSTPTRSPAPDHCRLHHPRIGHRDRRASGIGWPPGPTDGAADSWPSNRRGRRSRRPPPLPARRVRGRHHGSRAHYRGLRPGPRQLCVPLGGPSLPCGPSPRSLLVADGGDEPSATSFPPASPRPRTNQPGLWDLQAGLRRRVLLVRAVLAAVALIGEYGGEIPSGAAYPATGPATPCSTRAPDAHYQHVSLTNPRHIPLA